MEISEAGKESAGEPSGPPFDRSGEDQMGYSRAKQLEGYTDEMIVAARALATSRGFQWDCVWEDPAVTGKRFLNDARTVITALSDGATATGKEGEG